MSSLKIQRTQARVFNLYTILLDVEMLIPQTHRINIRILISRHKEFIEFVLMRDGTGFTLKRILQYALVTSFRKTASLLILSIYRYIIWGIIPRQIGRFEKF